jgi:hypothetical protein
LLYLIGGAARSGKTILARRLLLRHGLPYFPIDYLTSGLELGAPDTGVRHESSSRLRGEHIWPILEGLLRNIAEEEPGYVVEGDVLLPDRVAGFMTAYGRDVRACFLGYATATVEAKSSAIRSNSGHVNDWVADLAGDELAALVTEMIEFSAFLQGECARHRLKYIDSAADFDSALDAAEGYLLERLVRGHP